MHRSRAFRFVAVFMAVLVVLQLWLVGSGMACTMSAAVMAPTSRSMTVASMLRQQHASAADRSAMRAGAPHMPTRMPCQQQGSGPMCRGMGLSVAALVPAPLGPSTVSLGGSPRALALDLLMPPSETFPPELPPPRA